MSIPYLGDFPVGATIYVPFQTFDKDDGSSITMTGLAVTDIEIYKNGSTTQRASDAGYTLLDTDGIDFDGITGIHGFSIDTADNTTANFFTAGGDYWVVVSAVTVDSVAISFVAAIFSIENRRCAGELVRTTIATLASQTSFTLTAGSADNNAYVGCTAIVSDIASGIQKAVGYISAYTGATKTVTLAADPAIFTMAAGDNITILAGANVRAVGSTLQTAGDVVALINTVDDFLDTEIAAIVGYLDTEIAAILADTNELQVDWVNGGRLDLLIDAIKAKTDLVPAAPATEAKQDTIIGYLDTEVAAILADTNELQTDLVNGGRLDLLVDAIKAKTDLIPAAPAATGDIPSAATIADAVWDEAATGHVDAGKAGAQVWTDIDAILVDTAEIGAAGAGLTAVPYNAAWDADIQSECEDALAAYDPPTKAELDTGLDALPTAAEIKTAIEAAGGHLALILEDTAVIGAAGAGLTAVPWNASWDAEVQSEVFDALDAAFTDATGLTANGLLDRIRTLGWIVRNKIVVTDANGDTVIYKDDNSTAGFTVATMLTDTAGTTTRLRAA